MSKSEIIPYDYHVKIETAIDFAQEIEDIRAGKEEPWRSTGWPEMDDYYKITEGQLNIVSGYPGSGKSEWVESLMTRQIILNDAEILFFSPENWPSKILARKIMEKMAGKAINGVNCMNSEEYASSFARVSMFCHFINSDEKAYSCEELLRATYSLILSGSNIRHLVIDPWNEMDATRPVGTSETDYIGLWLMNCRKFARKMKINIWIVCHPAKPQKDKNGVIKPPTVYDLAGSAHWYNKADNAFICHRENKFNTLMTLMVKKIKKRQFGKLGDVPFNFMTAMGDYEIQGQYYKALPPDPNWIENINKE